MQGAVLVAIACLRPRCRGRVNYGEVGVRAALVARLRQGLGHERGARCSRCKGRLALRLARRPRLRLKPSFHHFLPPLGHLRVEVQRISRTGEHAVT